MSGLALVANNCFCPGGQQLCSNAHFVFVALQLQIFSWKEQLHRSADATYVEIGRLLASVEELDAHVSFFETVPLKSAQHDQAKRDARISVDRVDDTVDRAL